MTISLNDSNTWVVKCSLMVGLFILSACARPVVDPLLLPLSVDAAIPSELFVVRDSTGAPICIAT